MAETLLRFGARQLVLLGRDRQLIFWNVLFFLLLLVLFLGVLSGGDPSVRVTLTASLVTIGLMASSLFSIAVGLTSARERGVLRRYALTPAPQTALLLITVASRAILIVAAAALQIVVAATLFGVPASGGWTSWLAVTAVGCAAFAMLGFLIAAVAPSTHVANTLANLIFIPMMALSGTAVPLAWMPAFWRDWSWLLPSATIFDALLGAFVRGDTVVDNLGPLAYLLLWVVLPGVGGAYAFARREP